MINDVNGTEDVLVNMPKIRETTVDQINSLEILTGDNADVIVSAAIYGLLVHLGLRDWVNAADASSCCAGL